MIRRFPVQRGFTLLEVLVALAVVALALTAMIKTAGNSAGNLAHLKHKTMAHWIAMDRITELRTVRKWPSRGTRRDEVEMFGTEWTWIQRVSDTESPHLREVEVSVILTEDGDEDYPLITLETWLINPAIIIEGP